MVKTQGSSSLTSHFCVFFLHWLECARDPISKLLKLDLVRTWSCPVSCFFQRLPIVYKWLPIVYFNWKPSPKHQAQILNSFYSTSTWWLIGILKFAYAKLFSPNSFSPGIFPSQKTGITQLFWTKVLFCLFCPILATFHLLVATALAPANTIFYLIHCKIQIISHFTFSTVVLTLQSIL